MRRPKTLSFLIIYRQSNLWFPVIISKKRGPSTVPELPEVETVVRDLREPLVGRCFRGVTCGPHALRGGRLGEVRKSSRGKNVRSVERRGKWIIIDLDGPFLLVHLGMTGQLTVTSAKAPRQNHTHVTWILDAGDTELRFRDIRRFGGVYFFKSRQNLDAHFEKSGLGPEPFDMDPAYWRACLAKTSRSLKAILLDQRVVAGVGNIYADEALFEARLSPTLLGKNVSSREADRLRRAVATVLRRGIDKRGSSIRDYVGGSGLLGTYQDEFRVYGRAGEPCRRCRKSIARIRLAGRSTHFCPKCQKL
jgi:formamidopyrimidine-DNA glycosylase